MFGADDEFEGEDDDFIGLSERSRAHAHVPLIDPLPAVLRARVRFVTGRVRWDRS